MIDYLLAEAPSIDVTWGMLVRNFGVPGAMMAVFIFALYKGWFITGREAERREKDSVARETLLNAQCDHNNQVWDERYKELKQEAIERILQLRTEKDMWRDTATKGLKIATTATNAITAVTDTSGGMK